MDAFQVVEYGSIALSLFFFALGSVFDLKTREVPDKVWLVYGPTGLVLTVYRLTLEPSTVILALASMGLATLASFGLFYFGLFGGADAKAIICLGLTLPLAPTSYRVGVGFVLPFFPVSVLLLGYVSSVSIVVWLGVRNLLAYWRQRSALFAGLEHESRWRKILAALTGYTDDIPALERTFYLYPMEEVVEETNEARRRFHFLFDAESDRGVMVSKFVEALKKVGSPHRVWVSPGLPMLVFIFIGLIITVTLGDVIFYAIFRTILFHQLI